jgi:hypothetical protein
MSISRIFYVLTHWEQWHYNVKYYLLAPVWIWYSLKAGSFYFFVPANPGLRFGGFEGGPKQEMYSHLPEDLYPRSVYVGPSADFINLLEQIQRSGIGFPLAVKPDTGMMGLMFRKLDHEEELKLYHQVMEKEYIVQDLATQPMEVSVFYYRFPEAASGTITGFVRKEALEVVGDGQSSLQQLLKQLVNRPGFKEEEWKNKHKDRLHEIIPAGVVFKLSWVANLSRGARLVNIEDQKDKKLLAVFDRISHFSGFHYGRYDIKCHSIDELKEGRFTILEFNGAGGEPHHMYGNGHDLFGAFRIIIHHWDVLYRIAKMHARMGVPYWSLGKCIRFQKKANRHFRRLKELDKKMEVFH